MEIWWIIPLVILAIALIGAGAYWYLGRSLLRSIGTLAPLTAGVADYFLTNDYWANFYWPFDYWPAYGTAVAVTKKRRLYLQEEPPIW